MVIPHLRLFALAPDMLRDRCGKWFGDVEHSEQGWRWSFAAAARIWGADLNVASKWYETESDAAEALAKLRRALYPQEQQEARPDAFRLRALRVAIELLDSEDAADAPHLAKQAKAETST